MRLLVALSLIVGLPGVALGQSGGARFVFPTSAPAATTAPTDLFDAALVAGGTGDAARRNYYRNQFDAVVAELQTSGRATGSSFDRARAVHEFLHSRLLRTFHETATTLDAAFDAGRFNCISSVILFRCLATKFGLRAHGVEVPGHAYAVVETEAGPLVVQTTCPAWFAVLGDDAMRRAALRQTLGEAAVGADLAPTAGRRLDETGLTAIVYYNRGLDYLEAGRFAESLAANQTALRLDPQNATARANLLATLNNWSLDRYRRGDVAEAVRLLEQGLAIDPHYALFRENLAAVRGQTKIAP